MGRQHRAVEKRRMFKGTFIIGKSSRRVYARKSGDRIPIKSLSGPNIAREMRKGEPLEAWDRTALNVTEPRLLHELGRLF